MVTVIVLRNNELWLLSMMTKTSTTNTIFVAEVASTFNEQLTYEYLFNRAESKEERLYLISQQMDAIRSGGQD